MLCCSRLASVQINVFCVFLSKCLVWIEGRRHTHTHTPQGWWYLSLRRISVFVWLCQCVCVCVRQARMSWAVYSQHAGVFLSGGWWSAWSWDQISVLFKFAFCLSVGHSCRPAGARADGWGLEICTLTVVGGLLCDCKKTAIVGLFYVNSSMQKVVAVVCFFSSFRVCFCLFTL